MNRNHETFQTDKEFWESFWLDKNLSSKELLEEVASAIRSKYILEGLPSEGLILDAGCGNGKWDFLLSTHGNRVIGFDYALNTLQRNRAMAQEHKFSCFFLGGNVINLPIENGIFDGYLSIGLWEHFRAEEQSKLALEAFRVLRPGGIIVIDVPNLYSPWTITRKMRHYIRQRLKQYSLWQSNMSKSQLTHLCENSGFETILCINCDVGSSFKRALYLEIPVIKKIIPNPFYWMRGLFYWVAKKTENVFPHIGYDTIYIGRKP